eukprot:3505019-Prymnesium_polylepis.1
MGLSCSGTPAMVPGHAGSGTRLCPGRGGCPGTVRCPGSDPRASRTRAGSGTAGRPRTRVVPGRQVFGRGCSRTLPAAPGHQVSQDDLSVPRPPGGPQMVWGQATRPETHAMGLICDS